MERLQYQLDYGSCQSSLKEVDLGHEQEKVRLLQGEVLSLRQSYQILQNQLNSSEQEASLVQRQLLLEKELLNTKLLQSISEKRQLQEDNEILHKSLLDKEEDYRKQLELLHKDLNELKCTNDKAKNDMGIMECTLEEERRTSEANKVRATQMERLLQQNIQDHTHRMDQLRQNISESTKAAYQEFDKRISLLQERASRAEAGEASALQLLKSQEMKLTECLVLNEETLSRQHRTLTEAFKREKEDEAQEVVQRLQSLQQQRDQQELELSTIRDENAFLRKKHVGEMSATMSSINKLNEELANALFQVKKEKEENLSLQNELVSVCSLFLSLSFLSQFYSE